MGCDDGLPEIGCIDLMLKRIVETIKYRHIKKSFGYVLFKIIGSKGDKLIFQCVNTNKTFRLTVTELVQDIDIIHGLHPIQACYVGMILIRTLKNSKTSLRKNIDHQSKAVLLNRYGSLCLCYQDRQKNICFVNSKTNEVFIMNPVDVVLSENMISEFDAAQAYFIGLLAGELIEGPFYSSKNKLFTLHYPFLRSIK